jgi:hypothetical protein
MSQYDLRIVSEAQDQSHLHAGMRGVRLRPLNVRGSRPEIHDHRDLLDLRESVMVVALAMVQSLLPPTHGSLLRFKTSHNWLPMTDLTLSTLGAPLFWPLIDRPMTVAPETDR